jgi:hypothetical protein
MGSILINFPDIADSDLVFSEGETRQILKFFWPERAGAIDDLTVDNEIRRLAQTALIAAIDGSYAMGFVEATIRATVRSGSNIKSLAKKLAGRFVKHWWKHAKQHDLGDVKVYESVRVAIAQNLGRRVDAIINGVAQRHGFTPFYGQTGSSRVIWA